MSMNAIHRAQSGLECVSAKAPVHRSQHGKHEYRGSPGRTHSRRRVCRGARPVTERNQAGGSDPVRNAIEGKKQAQITYSANLAVLKVASDMQGELVDLKA